MTVVCIAGMHRSGTSMVARLLNLCGLYLGKDEELMPPTQDNVDGYWENLRFVEINDSLLAQLNGAWDLPPVPDSDLEMQKQPLPLVEKAQTLIQSFDDQTVWGWKDPRSSLTLPFWQKHIPNLKVISCIRNPLEVAQSLAKRDHFSAMFSFELWYTYNQRLLSAVAPEDLLTTHYSVYFTNPQDEIRRLLEFIGIQADSQTVEMACTAAKRTLKHNRSTFEYLIAEGAPLKVVNLYAELCSQAGPIFWNGIKNNFSDLSLTGKYGGSEVEYHLMQRLIDKDPIVPVLAAHIAKKEQAAQALTAQVAEKDKTIQAFAELVAEKEQAIQSFMAQVAEKEQVAQALTGQVAEKDKTIQAFAELVAEKEQVIKAFTAQATEKDKTIQAYAELVAGKDQVIQAFTAQVAEKDQTVQALTAQVIEKGQTVQALSAQMHGMTSSKAWKLVTLLHNIRIWLLPKDSQRERFAKKVWHGKKEL
jgi:hypothetical protein